MSGLTYPSMIPILADINSASNVGWCPVLSYPDECSGHHEPLPCWCASNLLLHRFHLTAFFIRFYPCLVTLLGPSDAMLFAGVLSDSTRNTEPLEMVERVWCRQGSALKDWSESGFASRQPTFPGGPDVASSQMSYPDLFCLNQTSFHNPQIELKESQSLKRN